MLRTQCTYAFSNTYLRILTVLVKTTYKKKYSLKIWTLLTERIILSLWKWVPSVTDLEKSHFAKNGGGSPCTWPSVDCFSEGFGSGGERGAASRTGAHIRGTHPSHCMMFLTCSVKGWAGPVWQQIQKNARFCSLAHTKWNNDPKVERKTFDVLTSCQSVLWPEMVTPCLVSKQPSVKCTATWFFSWTFEFVFPLMHPQNGCPLCDCFRMKLKVQEGKTRTRHENGLVGENTHLFIVTGARTVNLLGLR